METFKQFIPTKLIFGWDCLDLLATEKLPGKKAMLVISAGKSMIKFGYLRRVRALLAANGVEVVLFTRTKINPIVDDVMYAANICRQEKCDFVVGLGGGNSIDSAKAIAIMARNPGHYWDYVNDGNGLGLPVSKGALPIVAIPTTAGTGSEMTSRAVIIHVGRNEKIGFSIPQIFPTLSIVDPELTVSLDMRTTAYQGFEALLHSVEAYLANTASPLSDLYALESIRLLSRYLPQAVENETSQEARTQVAWASTLAGMAQSASSCISLDSLEHALSVFFPEIPHSVGLIMISVAYFTALAGAASERYKKLAQVMTGVPSNDPMDFITALQNLQRVCEADDLKMSEWRVHPSDLRKLVPNARKTMSKLFEADPAPVTDELLLKILQAAYR